MHPTRNESGSILIQAQVVSRSQQLETELDRDVHVGNINAVAILVPVVAILDHFVEDHGAVVDHQPLLVHTFGVFSTPDQQSEVWMWSGQV